MEVEYGVKKNKRHHGLPEHSPAYPTAALQPRHVATAF
jgi:hypothetical protein